MKVFDVAGPGPFLDPVGKQTQTQDFTFNNAPLLELKDLPTTREIFTIREAHFDDPEGLKAQISKRDDNVAKPSLHELYHVLPIRLPLRHICCQARTGAHGEHPAGIGGEGAGDGPKRP